MSIKSILSKIGSFFASGSAQKAIDTAASFVPFALPYIDIAAEIITGITPTTLDDKALALVKTKFPGLFDGSLKTGDEVKLYGLAVASSLMSSKYPLGTTIARASVQLAYTGKTA